MSSKSQLRMISCTSHGVLNLDVCTVEMGKIRKCQEVSSQRCERVEGKVREVESVDMIPMQFETSQGGLMYGANGFLPPARSEVDIRNAWKGVKEGDRGEVD